MVISVLLGVSTVQANENTLCICHFPASLREKRKNKHTALYFDIYIVYVSSTALCAVNALAWINYSSSYLATIPRNTFVKVAEKNQPTTYQFSYNECIIH